MAIRLNSYMFDTENTSVRDSMEEVGGRDERKFVLSGLIVGKSSVDEVESELDLILDEASKADCGAKLSLREDREFAVERARFERKISEEEIIGAFELELRADDPFEYATQESTDTWNVTASGQTTQQTAAGNVYSKPRFTLTASGDVVNPSISDGTRTVTYTGTVADGEVLVFDCAAGTVTLEGEDVVPYTTGEFPQISSEGTTLEYTDDALSSHTASIQIAYRDRWW
jgi:phage-related protein